MIVVDLGIFLSVLVSACVLLMVIRFLFEQYKKVLWLGHQKYLIQCSLCTHQFFIYRRDNVGVCPRCKKFVSLNDSDEVDG